MINLIKKELDSGLNVIIYLLDEESLIQGEYISKKKDGKLYFHAFKKDGNFIGKVILNDKCCYYSMYKDVRNPLKDSITKEEYRKELVMLRLGIIKVPEFSYLLKDYEVS